MELRNWVRYWSSSAHLCYVLISTVCLKYTDTELGGEEVSVRQQQTGLDVWRSYPQRSRLLGRD